MGTVTESLEVNPDCLSGVDLGDLIECKGKLRFRETLEDLGVLGIENCFNAICGGFSFDRLEAEDCKCCDRGVDGLRLRLLRSDKD